MDLAAVIAASTAASSNSHERLGACGWLDCCDGIGIVNPHWSASLDLDPFGRELGLRVH